MAKTVPLQTPAVHAKEEGASSSHTASPSPLFQRVGETPLLEPTTNWWESVGVLNPGVAEDENGVIHLLYRAIGRDGISRFGHATTRDGKTLETRSATPILEPEFHDEFEVRGIEDPRITKIGDTFFIVYTAASLYDEEQAHTKTSEPVWRVRISLVTTKDFAHFTRHGVLLPDLDNKDAVLFPEVHKNHYLLLHRLPPDIWISSSPDLHTWDNHISVVHTRPASWDERKIGAGAPPLRIPEGWLLAYHGSDHHNVYRAGFLLLDGDNPFLVRARSDRYAFQPEVSYEYDGVVPRVVFPTGLVRRDDELLLFYGAADKYIGVARGSLRAVLASLRPVTSPQISLS